jgi:hypothetical protein
MRSSPAIAAITVLRKQCHGRLLPLDTLKFNQRETGALTLLAASRHFLRALYKRCASAHPWRTAPWPVGHTDRSSAPTAMR